MKSNLTKKMRMKRTTVSFSFLISWFQIRACSSFFFAFFFFFSWSSSSLSSFVVCRVSLCALQTLINGFNATSARFHSLCPLSTGKLLDSKLSISKLCEKQRPPEFHWTNDLMHVAPNQHCTSITKYRITYKSVTQVPFAAFVGVSKNVDWESVFEFGSDSRPDELHLDSIRNNHENLIRKQCENLLPNRTQVSCWSKHAY